MTLRRTVLVLPLSSLAVLAAACQPPPTCITPPMVLQRQHVRPGVDRFNLADVSSVGMVNSLPSGVKGLVYVGQCGGYAILHERGAALPR